MVARRQVPRIREQAASRLRSRQQLGPVRDRRRTRRECHTAAAHDVRGPGQRSRDRESPGVEPRRPLHRLPPGWPPQAHLLRRSEARSRAGRRGRAPHPHGGARSQRREPGVVERRVVHHLPARRRPGGRARARAGSGGGAIERLVSGSRVVSAFAAGANGRLAVLASTPLEPAEVFALDGTTLRPLSRQNDAWLSRVRLGPVEPISFKSRDGTAINGFVVKPPDFVAGKRYPTILRIHGGPVSQYQNEFDFQLQTLAGHGYLVVVANPRGSSGRGEQFSTAIFADWGNKDAQDVLAAVDYAAAQGLADPARLGVGGWSYGGILTNYVIAQDRRFKAAVSGASISNILAGYGTDQYVREYEAELGVPWKAADTWVRLSSPFLHADRINTPTLFLCGDKDFNVPLLNSEQMYQALRSLGRETQLVVYPGEYHTIRRPSFVRDRLQRYA